MPLFPASLASRARRAFTLIELLVVIAVVALLGALVLSISPGNPKGIKGATKQVESLLSLAQTQAKLGTLNDPDEPTGETQRNRYGTVRARLLILNDKDDPVNHLRLMGIVVGAQVRSAGNTTPFKTEKELQEADLTWFANDGAPVLLPDNIFYAENNLSALKNLLRSDAKNLTFANAPTMQLDYPKRSGQKSGSGRTWYYYEFLADGSCNMRDDQSASDTSGTTGTGARLMIVEGILNPAQAQPTIENKENPRVGGVIVTPRGKLLPITGLYEVK